LGGGLGFWLGVVIVLRLGNAGVLWLGVTPAGVGILWTPVGVVWEVTTAGNALRTKTIARLAMAKAHTPRAIPAGLEFPRM
jgi:hypothetical protein